MQRARKMESESKPFGTGDLTGQGLRRSRPTVHRRKCRDAVYSKSKCESASKLHKSVSSPACMLTGGQHGRTCSLRAAKAEAVEC